MSSTPDADPLRDSSAAPDVSPLRALDQVSAATLDPKCLAANLSALHDVAPSIAAQLERTSLPASWRAVTAFDGSVTYRLEARNEAARWLGASAMPRDRAAALMPSYESGSGGASMPYVVAGYEIDWLLSHLRPILPVFLFVDDRATFRAALTLHDWSRAFRSQRLQVIFEEDPLGALERCAQELPGMFGAGNLVRIPGLDETRVEQVREWIEAAHAKILPQQQRAWETNAGRVEQLVARGSDGLERIAVLNSFANGEQRLAGEFLRAVMSATGREARVIGPRDVQHAHPGAQLQAIVDLAPGVLVEIDEPVLGMPESVRTAARRWVTSLSGCSALKSAHVEDAREVAVATGAIEARLGTSLTAEMHALHWPAMPNAPDDSAQRVGGALLLGRQRDDGAERLGIAQPTHKALLKAAQILATEHWIGPLSTSAESLLREAERLSDARIRDAEFRAHMVHWIEDAIVPARGRQALLHRLNSAGVDVQLLDGEIGATESSYDSVERLLKAAAAEDSVRSKDSVRLKDSVPLEDSVPLVVAYQPADPWACGVIWALSRGWPVVLVHGAPGELETSVGWRSEPTAVKALLRGIWVVDSEETLAGALRDARGAAPASISRRAAGRKAALAAFPAEQFAAQLSAWLGSARG